MRTAYRKKKHMRHALQNLTTMKQTIKTLLFLLLAPCLMMQAKDTKSLKRIVRNNPAEYYSTAEAQRIGEQVMMFQRVTGGWPKNTDMVSRLTDDEREAVIRDRDRTDDSTVDNDATTTEMNFLARLYAATHKAEYRDAVGGAIRFLLSGQYENGGWPQFWPDPQGYQVHITYNDGNMANILRIFRDINTSTWPYDGDILDDETRAEVRASFNKAIDCILRTQIRVKGKPTVWCQQHDHVTYAPAPARAFELPSFCTAESAGLVAVLMSIPNPDKRIQDAVNGAMAWFDKYKLTGLRVERTGSRDDWYNADARLVRDSTAKPIWGRFYDLGHNEPFVCDRDGIPRRDMQDIGFERRLGYGWYTDSPMFLYSRYERWAKENNVRKIVSISLQTKGCNENGTITLNRKPVHNPRDYDAVVSPGQSIQAAIERAPEHPTRPYTIFIRKGLYEQKVIIDKPNIVLVGEDRDNTIIRIAETEEKRMIETYRGRKVHHGVIVLTEEADSCVITGLTVYNNYGTVVEPGNTRHQMAIFGRADHTIIINSNVWADGNDALSLWANQKDGGGMYYHADLDLRCKGVDFLCPRGWCYATRCRFYGDGHAMIWHDGRGDKTKKLVITNSTFDAASPTKLGRWHHDSMFYLINCRMTKNVLDSDIQYAYSDKVLDPCPWGQRVYYLNCAREGGHSGWLNDNIDESEEPGTYHSTTATWTFHNKWDPEKHIRDLWPLIAY